MPLSISRFCAFRKAQKHNSLFLIPKLPIFKEKHFICLSEIWTVSPFYVVCRICLKKRNHFKSFELKCFIGPPSWLVKFADISLLHRKKIIKVVIRIPTNIWLQSDDLLTLKWLGRRGQFEPAVVFWKMFTLRTVWNPVFLWLLILS